MFTEKLKGAGFTVDSCMTNVLKIEGHGVFGAFSEEYWMPDFPVFTRRLLADNVGCFNKWSQCPLVMSIESVLADPEKAIEHLLWLGSAEGFKYSNEFDYLDDPVIPFKW